MHRVTGVSLWAAILAGRMGRLPETGLNLGRLHAASSPRAMAQPVNIADKAQQSGEIHVRPADSAPRLRSVRFLRREVPASQPNDTLRTEDECKLASAKGVHTYIVQAFGDRLPGVRAAMEAVAACRRQTN